MVSSCSIQAVAKTTGVDETAQRNCRVTRAVRQERIQKNACLRTEEEEPTRRQVKSRIRKIECCVCQRSSTKRKASSTVKCSKEVKSEKD